MRQYNEILKKLYNGDIKPKEEKLGEEYLCLQQKNNKILKKIFNNIDSKTKELLEEYLERQSELESIDAEKQFESGYKIGIKLIVAGICKSE